MKCGNPGCKYELLGPEEQYYICPYCGQVIEENAENNPYEDEEEMSKYYMKVKETIKDIKGALIISILLVDFVTRDIILSDYTKIIMVETLSFTHSRRQARWLFLMPIIIPSLVYSAINRKNRFLAILFGDKVRYINTITGTILKGGIYIIVMMLTMGKEVTFFRNCLLESGIYHYNHTIEQIMKMIENLITGHKILIVYSYIVYYAMDWLDLYQYNLIDEINEEDD